MTLARAFIATMARASPAAVRRLMLGRNTSLTEVRKTFTSEPRSGAIEKAAKLESEKKSAAIHGPAWVRRPESAEEEPKGAARAVRRREGAGGHSGRPSPWERAVWQGSSASLASTTPT